MKAIQVSKEGKFYIGGVEVDDQGFCEEFVQTLRNEEHVCFGEINDEKIFIEAKSFPLIVNEVEVNDSELVLSFGYGFKENFSFSDEAGLYLDDWSRVCGMSKKNVPFVFSRAAQTTFLDKLVETVDYNMIKLNNKEIELKEWYVENLNTLKKDFWSERYKVQDSGWDLGQGHPCIDEVLPRLKLQKSKIIIPGSGRGHDVFKFHEKGHAVLGLDSSDVAVSEAKELYPKCNFECGDFFKYAKTNQGQYDYVFEHTLFCALNPSERSKLIKSWKMILRPGGSLIGVFMGSHKRGGPPFGITEWELEELLSPHFKINYWGRLRGKETARAGREIFVFAERR